MGRQNPRTDGKSKPIQTMSHKEAYTYTLIKRKNIYICIKRKKGREQPKQETNPSVILSTKY